MKRKLLFLIPSLVGGGAERNLINLLQKLDYTKFEIDLVVVVKMGAYLNSIPPEVKVIYLYQTYTLIRAWEWLQKKANFDYFLKRRTEKMVKSRYDLGISFLDGNFTDLLFYMKGVSKKYTWVHSSYKTNHNFARFYENKDYVTKLKRKRYGKLDGIFFVSHDAKKEFIEVFGEYPNMQVLYNLIDRESILKKSRIETPEPSNVFHFITLGRLLPVKGYDRLIRASKIVQQKGFDFKVSIVGSGSEKSNLEALVQKLNLHSSVEFVDFLPNPYPQLKSADVFIMSSISEALPTALCEAMILGKATLVTNSSGCSEIVDNGEYGLMAEQDDQSLAKHMIKYLSNPQVVLYYEQKSGERAKLFDDSLVLKEYNKILSE